MSICSCCPTTHPLVPECPTVDHVALDLQKSRIGLDFGVESSSAVIGAYRKNWFWMGLGWFNHLGSLEKPKTTNFDSKFEARFFAGRAPSTGVPARSSC